MKYYHIK